MRTAIAIAMLGFSATALIGQNPIQAAKDALNKAKQQQQPGQPPPQQKPGQAKPGQPPQAAANTETGPFTPPAGTKIDSVIVAPVEQGSLFGVSSHGVHVATLSHSGSRAVMIYDGVAGPKFDQIFPQGSAGMLGVMFSPDGNRYGYCGKLGNEFIVIVDGKEFGRSAETTMMGTMGGTSCSIGFTPSSRHAYYTSAVRADASHDAARFVYDGKVSPIGASGDLRDYTFSPDDNHYTYPWTDPANVHNQKLVVDGNPAPYAGTAPQWSADSQHLFTKFTAPGKPGIDILQDGKPVMRADFVRLFIPPVGNMGIAAISRNAGGVTTQFLSIGGKVVPGSEVQGQIADVVFSPDGKHYAALYKLPSQRQFVFADGKRGLDYQGLGSITSQGTTPRQMAFTGDSSKVVYVAVNDRQFLVVGDQETELPLHADETVISPVGNRVATSGQGMVILDGKTIGIPNVDPHTSHAGSLKFSPDGSHFAFALQDRGGITLFLDGVAQAGFGVVNANYTNFLFSPDSKHIACFCRPPNGSSEVGVCVDGKYARAGSQSAYENLTWSADSRHLFWSRKTAAYSYRIFADGQPVFDAQATSPAGFSKETFQADPAGALLVLSQDDASLKRVSIVPSTASSIAAMTGGADPKP